MAKYIYRAKTRDGSNIEGSIVADTTDEATAQIKKQDLILLSLDKEKKGGSLEISFLSIIKLEDKMIFARNLAVMIDAGLSLPRALDIISTQTKNTKFKDAIKSMSTGLIEGTSFSDVIAEHPKIFSRLFSSMVKVGEATGTLGDVLKVLAKQMEKQHDLREEIKGALIYPIVIILAMVGIGIGMIVGVVPQISKTFAELDLELPPSTRAVIGVGDFMVHRWYIVVGALIGLIILFLRLRKQEWFKDISSRASLRLPFVSSLIERINSARTLRSLSSLIAAGVSLPSALEIVAEISGNSLYRREIEEVTKQVIKGDKLSDALEDKRVYPTLVIQMIAVGEETGETASVLDNLANFYEQQVMRSTKNIASVVEPIIMLFVGGVIGFFAISMIQPMYSMIGQFQ